MDGFVFETDPATGTDVLTMEGLTGGNTYQLQLFVSDDRGASFTKKQFFQDIDGGGLSFVHFLKDSPI